MCARPASGVAFRLPARTAGEGVLLTLAEQDRSRWDRALIARGLRELARSAAGERLTADHLQAGIAAAHALAPEWAATDWPRILDHYNALLALGPSPVVALNRVVALAMVAGPRAALAELAMLGGRREMGTYHLYHAVLADLRVQLGDVPGAATAYAAALALVTNEAERRFLRRRLAALPPADGCVP